MLKQIALHYLLFFTIYIFLERERAENASTLYKHVIETKQSFYETELLCSKSSDLFMTIKNCSQIREFRIALKNSLDCFNNVIII